ncbi:MAG: endopeptidase La [Lachnospiraceae bacterium]|nr:endopeptidase La [Lachnospiraceae bacterium]
MSNQNRELPLIALRRITIFPNMLLNFDVNRDKSKAALDRAMAMDSQEIFVVMQKDPEVVDPSFDDLHSIGVIAKVKQLAKMPGNVVRVLVEGKVRAELLSIEDDGEAKSCEVAVCGEPELPEELVEEAMCRTVKELFASYSVLNTRINKELVKVLQESQSLDYLLDQIMIQMPVDYTVKQKVLELVDVSERYGAVVELLSREREILRIKKEFQEQVKGRIDKNQKDYIMREQMKLIREELGEDEASDADKYTKQLEKLKADKAVKDKIKSEIKRLEHMSGNNSEGNVIRNYIESLLALPWNKSTKDVLDIKAAEDILEAEHYGLEKVKERVLEFLAVRAFAKKGDSPIICLVGPPGTGKTSIARSIAKALNREYVRICLGGVRDEAEIRGHRRTYVGAMPGRIVAGLKNVGVKNPLMLLDEIDKVSSDHRGDTSSALLEVLDSEQNNKFCDHYVELPIDLSEVMFVATANSAQDIPKPLLDRMEIIELSGYTENEKEHIAKDYLVPKQIEKHGLEGKITISDKAVKAIIHSYTREAGVRSLERKIGALCRKAAKELLEGKKKQVRITESNLKTYLGKELHRFNMANEKPEIGIVRGLAWTSVGGDTLEIEVVTMPGKGELVLTGKLGDVMKESARTAISYVRSIADRYDVKPEFFEKNDIHVHVPEGAVPKDGPSAGITMSLAILSAVIKKPVRADLAMTGEVTLRGRVLPIGGLKEKLLAAKLAGIKTVLVPEKNKNDVEEISAEIKKDIEIIFVASMDEVIERGFTD